MEQYSFLAQPVHSYCKSEDHITAQYTEITVHNNYTKKLPICLHDVFKWPKKVFLETEICKFSLLQKLHRQLSQRIDSEKCNVFIWIASNL